MKNKIGKLKGMTMVGLMALTLSTSAFAAETDPYANNKELQDIFKVYEEAPDNGMLLAPNPNVVDKEIEDNNTSVLNSIGTFFNGIFNWFMGILG